MPPTEFSQLRLLAEIDGLIAGLERWAEAAPAWPPAEECRALVRRLAGRAAALRVRLEAPLVVATLGGTGTGKSALINALAGGEVVRTGRQRPTTTRSTIICRPGVTPQMLGIDSAEVELVQRDLPGLAQLVLVDCPDPDTTEEPAGQCPPLPPGEGRGEGTRQSVVAGRAPLAATVSPREGQPTASCQSNLARLRAILPHCDVLLVTTTQQKYRSARVEEELRAAARGARLVFVQTHADVDADIRDDWRQLLADDYTPGHIFLIDSLAVLADAQQGVQPRGEATALSDLLTRQFAGAAAARIRRENFLDLAAETLAACGRRLDEALPAVGQLLAAVDQQREQLAARLARQMQAELLANRRPWENRLLGQATSRWGLSPFALVLRIYQDLGSLAAGAMLYRARTPAQLALWGAAQGARSWQKHRRGGQARRGVDRAVAGGWDAAELRAAALVLEGYATEAGLPRQSASLETITSEAETAGLEVAGRLATDLDAVVARLAQRHTGWFTRWRYELLLCALLGVLLFRLGKNFFYDSWWAPNPAPVWGLESYVAAAFWLALWSVVLVWLFAGRLRRGLRREIGRLAEGWTGAAAAGDLFVHLEAGCRQAEQFRADLRGLEDHLGQLRRRLATAT
jgi:hypothetical protein